jgi:hypothetical protein
LEETKIGKNVPRLTLAEEILNMDDSESEIVVVPQWKNKKILCKNMTGAERARLAKLVTFDANGVMDNESTSADVVMAGSYDPDNPNEKIFSGSQREFLLNKNSAALELLGGVINRLSGISRDSQKKAEKN